jgi:hypothetical protein
MLLNIPCPGCSGRGLVTWDHPNDPCARLEVCDECNGDKLARCHCGATASDAWIEGTSIIPLCARHFAEHQAEIEA